MKTPSKTSARSLLHAASGLTTGLLAATLLLPAVACGPGTTVDGDPEPSPEPDMVAEPDMEPEVIEPTGPAARVYLTNPADGLSDVVLVPPTSDDGSLTGEFVNTLNCTNSEGGPSVFGFGNLCLEEKTVFPDEDGNYTAVLPPETESGEDPFAEVQMYHHVNVVHAYFSQTHGLTDLDFPLDAIVNLTISFQGQWQPFDNAAFMPPEAFAQFGLPMRDNGAIVFGQGTELDFSYDSSVIYHEYAHAVAGTGRLNGAFLDQFGLNNTPGALNEGMADYFASTILDDANLGEYALGAQARDLATPHRCPDDMTTEIHADGKIIGSALWAARETFGPDVVDAVAFGAVMSATQTTGMEDFGTLLLVEAGSIFTEQADYDAFEEVLVDYGVVGCQRARTWQTESLTFTTGVPHAVEGSDSLQGQTLPDGVPGYHGWKVTLEEGQMVRLSWDLVAAPSFFGPTEVQPLGLALNRGSPVTMGLTGGIVADRLIDAPPVDDNDRQAVEIGGACVPSGGGDVYLLFRNEGAATSSVGSIQLETISSMSGDVPSETCD